MNELYQQVNPDETKPKYPDNRKMKSGTALAPLLYDSSVDSLFNSCLRNGVRIRIGFFPPDRLEAISHVLCLLDSKQIPLRL